ncbi:MAG: FixH family protein [Gammaproteobacteria bacterium]|nr:FixH family protein [Gammaproteobacteria bacterium]
MRPPREDTKPWYKQFWPWFLISLPLSVVIASMYTINLAIQTNDGLVSDDYYKEGLAIHKDADSKARATALGITGDLSYDADTGAVMLELTKALTAEAGVLTLTLTHPTVPNRDQTAQLTPLDDRRFSGRVDPVTIANWQVEIRPADGSWRIDGRLNAPAATRTTVD